MIDHVLPVPPSTSNYVGRSQIRDAFRSARVRQASLAESWAKDEQWAELFIRIRWQGLRREDLTPEERAVAGMRYLSLLHHLAAIYEDVQLGLLPSSAYRILGTETFTVPYMRDVWPVLRGEHSPEFVEFFETRFGLKEVSDSVQRVPPGEEAPAGEF